ncbi:MAG: protein-S-isoprenylcysteine O-methyltransferase [Pseudomonadota bacterium]
MSDVAFAIWALMIVCFAALRYPAMRKARRQRTAGDHRDVRDISLLVFCVLGLFVVPLFWWFSGVLALLDFEPSVVRVVLGTACALAFLWLFRRSHKDLGKNWSVSLEVREGHQLVTDGVYKYVRHPMYVAFLLWGSAQWLLIANHVASIIGLVSVLALFAGRHRREEAMMRATFGAAYDAYARNTKRLLPGVY